VYNKGVKVGKLLIKENKMVVTVEKDTKPLYTSKPWVIKVDGRIFAWNFKSKKSAIDSVEATGNKVANK
jgi:hypothetical protein